MSFGVRSSDYFNKYDDRFSAGDRSGRHFMSAGSLRYNRDRGETYMDSRSRTNSSGFGGGMGNRAGMQDYNMGYNDMRGRAEYNGMQVRSPIMRGMKRNRSPVYGGRSSGGIGMGGNLSTTEALLSLGLQAKQLLENQAAYGPPAAKMRRLNAGYERPMVRDRSMSRRGKTRGGAVRSRGGSTRVQKPREVPAWRKTFYHCNFCQKATKSITDHAEHVKTKEHASALKERKQKLVDKMYSLHKHAQANAEQARMQGRAVNFCGICSLEYVGTFPLHKKSKDHLAMMFLLQVRCTDCNIIIPNRIQYERHIVSQFHIRNHIYKRMEAHELDEGDEELECPEEYDETVGVGNMYVNDRRAVYCKVCDKFFENKDVKAYEHCKSKEHFDNFKDFVVRRKAVLKEKAAEKAKETAAAKESEGNQEINVEGADDEEETVNGESEDEENAVNGESDEEKAVNGESDDEEKAVNGESEDEEKAVNGESEDEEKAVNAESEDEEKAVNGESEDEEKAVNGEAEDEEKGVNGEAEDAEEVDEDQVPAEAAENEDVEIEKVDKEVPVKSTKKSPAVKARTTPKRITRTK